MKKYTKYIVGIAALCIVVFIGAFVRHTPLEKGLAQSLVYYQAGTNTGVLCNSTSTLMLATSTGSRTYERIENISATPIYLSLGTNATVYNGIPLGASSTWDMGTNQVVYAGSVYCISSSGTASTSIVTIP